MDALTHRRCLALYSGGLDSILAIKVMEGQGFEVMPLYFCTPFMGLPALLNPAAFVERHQRLYGVKVRIIDYTEDLTAIIKAPPHGFGRHLNPCIDCKIGMLRRARALLEETGSSFVVTGEVLGQRPMSQRRTILPVIERASGLEGLLLRPLCARHLPVTLPESRGLVDREALWDIRGRGRTVQIERAASYGITGDNVPTPAGGCLLTDRQISRRVRDTFDRVSPGLPSRADLLLDVVGRRFRLDPHTILVVGRNEEENRIMETFTDPGNVFLAIEDVPGPLCIIRGDAGQEQLRLAAGICLRYGKAKGSQGRQAAYGVNPPALDGRIQAPVLSDDFCRSLQD
jgi:hypothetical protein